MPARRNSSKRAPLAGALFFVLLLSLACAQAAPPCQAKGQGFSAVVSHVYDGDTVRTRSGERIRLIGINTPEMPRKRRPAEPLAREARLKLVAILQQAGNRIRVIPGQQQRDRYGRLLAHLLLPDGRNVHLEMLGKGLAFRIAIPPNLQLQDCYRQAELEARKARRGIWSQAYFRILDARKIRSSQRGFRRILGTIKAVMFRRGWLLLRLEGRVDIRIHRASIPYFSAMLEQGLGGRQITARGWVYPRRGRMQMSVRHPNDIIISRKVRTNMNH
jgi:endonuclease YncB( thermonuclease family)